MGNILDELNNILAIDCDECGGAGFLFFGDEDNFDVMTCNCVSDVSDELTLDWEME